MAKKIKQPLTNAQRRRKRRRTLIIIEVIVLLIVILFLVAWLKFGLISCESLGNLDKNNLSNETIDLLNGYKCIAFFGVDNRSNGNFDSGNSDSIMVACINNDTKEVRVISLYRDTSLMHKDNVIRKCNYAYNHGGYQEAIEMLNRNLDLDIQNYVAVDFNALSDVIDDIGGVEITLTEEEAKLMNDDYIGEVAKITGKTSNGVAAGPQTLNGVEATAYCRLRYTSGGDFKRAERQRTVLSQMVNKIKTMSATQALALATDENVLKEISTSLSAKDIAILASAMRDYTLGATTGFPFDKTTGTYGSKGSLVVPCTLETNVSKLYFFLFNKENYVPSETVHKISQDIIDLTGKTEKSAEHDEY
ncbi:MAG: LCP family protein [Lachnospiraceae bacterium]|nr:LCP family protein [Lachnospiraceae bacterium]